MGLGGGQPGVSARLDPRQARHRGGGAGRQRRHVRPIRLQPHRPPRGVRAGDAHPRRRRQAPGRAHVHGGWGTRAPRRALEAHRLAGGPAARPSRGSTARHRRRHGRSLGTRGPLAGVSVGSASSRTFASLRRHRNYRLYFGGQVVSLSGTWMQNVAQAWLIIVLTHGSAFAVGALALCQFGPYALFGLFGGSLADRINGRRTLVFTQSASMAVAAALAGLALTH